MVRKFTKTSLAIMVLAGAVGTAQAAGPVGSIVTATADLVFNAATTLQHTLTAKTGFGSSINGGTVLATGEISSTDTTSLSMFGLKYTPGIGTTPAGVSPHIRVLDGKSNSANKLTVAMASKPTTGLYDGWYYNNVPASNHQYEIQANGNQKVMADTYLLSLDASFFTP